MAENEDDNLPSDFFDDFAKDEFIKGLSVIDSWGDEVERDLCDKSPKNSGDVKSDEGKYKNPSPVLPPLEKGALQSATDRDISAGNRRDPAKTILAIKKDKEMKVKRMLTKCLESNDDIRPPGTELDEFYQSEAEDITQRKESRDSVDAEPSSSDARRKSLHREKERIYPKKEYARELTSSRPHRGFIPEHRTRFPDRFHYFKGQQHTPSRRSKTPIRLYRDSPVALSKEKYLHRSGFSPLRSHSHRKPHSRRSRSPRRGSRSPRRISRSSRRRSRSSRRGSPSPKRRSRSSRGRSQSPRRRESPRWSAHSREKQYFPSPPRGYPTRRMPSLSPGVPAEYNYSFQSQPMNSNAYSNPPAPYSVTPVPGFAYGDSAAYTDVYSYEGASMMPLPVPAPVPMPEPVPAPDVHNLLLPNQYSNLQVAPDGSISHVPPRDGSKEGWSMDITSKVELLARCHEAVSNLSRLHLPNRLMITDHHIVPAPKPLMSRYCSPLKRAPMVSFKFTNLNGHVDQNKSLIESITASIGLDLLIDKPMKRLTNTCDKGVQTSVPFCQMCEIRSSIRLEDAETQVVSKGISVETQVIEKDLASSKSIFVSASGVSDSAMSICHLTPAQLVSQLAARAKTFKQSHSPQPRDYRSHGMGPKQNYDYGNKYNRY